MKKIMKFLNDPWINFVLVLAGYIGIGFLGHYFELQGHVFDGVSIFFGICICYLCLWGSDCVMHIFKSWKSSGSPDDDNNKNESE